MKTTASDVLVETLLAWGVDTVFGIPGDGINGIIEAFRKRQDRMRFVQVRHEEAAAFAACAYAKFTGRLGVCMATSGPGGIHLANGLYDAKGDDEPVLAITGHTWTHLIGTHYQQDVALDRLYMDVAAYTERVASPNRLYRVLDEAIKTSLSRCTVSHINLPRDIAKQPVTEGVASGLALPRLMRDLLTTLPALPAAATLQEAAAAINAGRRVAIMSGRGAIPARDEVIQLAELVAG